MGCFYTFVLQCSYIHGNCYYTYVNNFSALLPSLQVTWRLLKNQLSHQIWQSLSKKIMIVCASHSVVMLVCFHILFCGEFLNSKTQAFGEVDSPLQPFIWKFKMK